MIFKVIIYILLLLIVLTFFGLNWDNTSDISLWFGDSIVLKNVPVCISVFIGFILGALSVIPIMIKHYTRIKKKSHMGFRKTPEELENIDSNPNVID